MHSSTNSVGTEVAAIPDLGSVAARGLRTPLAALRAALETLEAELSEDLRARQLVRRALDELGRVTQSTDALAEYVLPAPLHPLRCSLRELSQSALAGLSDDRRARIWVALEPGVDTLIVDGPLLSRCLTAFLSRATAALHSEVLLHAHRLDEVTTFAIVGDLSAREQGCEPNTAPERIGAVAEDFAVAVARRTIVRLGGQVADHDVSPHHCLIVRLFDQAQEDPA